MADGRGVGKPANDTAKSLKVSNHAWRSKALSTNNAVDPALEAQLLRPVRIIHLPVKDGTSTLACNPSLLGTLLPEQTASTQLTTGLAQGGREHLGLSGPCRGYFGIVGGEENKDRATGWERGGVPTAVPEREKSLELKGRSGGGGCWLAGKGLGPAPGS